MKNYKSECFPDGEATIRVKKDLNKLYYVHTEALMLMAMLTDSDARNEARAELKRRLGSEDNDPLPAGYITNFGIISC